MFDDKRYFTSTADEIQERGITIDQAEAYFTPVEMLIKGVKTKI